MTTPLPESAAHSASAPVASNPNEPVLLPSIKFGKQLAHFVDSSTSKPELIRKLAAVLQAEGCRGLWIIARDGSGKWTDPISLFGDDSRLRELIGAGLQVTVELAIRNRSLVSQDSRELPGNVFLGMPTFVANDVSDLIVGLFPAGGIGKLPPDWILKSVCESITRWQMNLYVQSTQEQLASLSSFVNMSAAVNRSQSRLEASITLVNELKTALDVDCVSLLLRHGRRGPFRLAAMSGVEFFDRNAATTQVIESTVLGSRTEAAFWPPSQNSAGNDTEEPSIDVSQDQSINLQNYCDQFSAPGCALLPIRDSEQHLFGWVLITLKESQSGNVKTEKHLRQISGLVAGHMEMVLRSQRTLRQLFWESTRRTLKHNLTKKLACVAAIATIVLCIPVTYKVGCDCQLQLTSRRFIAAPYEGMLDKSLVENGSLVEAGQPLARMDASQLRMEISGLQAKAESERKKRDSALARGSIAESQIARSEMDRLASEIKILEKRLNDTEIRSPIGGVVVSGDLDKAEGAPLEMGQNLFEVGPLENMLVEVLIPESEVQYVEVGMTTQFEFEAFPFEKFEGQIKRIHPRAEVIHQESVFVAEIELANESGQLRPGMKGRCKIWTQPHPLGWNLFHGAMEKARHWLIW